MLQTNTLPKPAGPCAIGFYHSSLTDTARGGRELPVMLWYPAASVDGHALRPYRSRAAFDLDHATLQATVQRLPWPLRAIFGRLLNKRRFVEIKTNASIGAPPLDGADPLPVLIFAPGYGGFMTQNTILIEYLASHGYAVLAMGVPGETIAEYPDGRISGLSPEIKLQTANQSGFETRRLLRALAKTRGKGLAEWTAVSRMIYMPTDRDTTANQRAFVAFANERMAVWYQDLLFVIGQLDTLAPFAWQLAVNNIGVFGMSMGGGLSSVAAFKRDPRIAATLSLDGVHYGMPFDGVIEAPHMIIHGYDTSRLLFEKMQRDAYYVTLANTEHLDYTDATLLEPVYKQLGMTGKKADASVVLGAINHYALAFFDKHVRGSDTDAVLRSPPPFAGVDLKTK
jgi:predicted dienelactone hydrolase